MKQFFIFLILFVAWSHNSTSQSIKKSPSRLLGIFDGRTPCDKLGPQVKEKVSPDCIKLKWRLGLYVDSITGLPDRYELIGAGYEKTAPKIGKWHILKGAKTNPNATIYQLDMGNGKKPILLQKAGENILFFLDQQKNIMVGNRDFSYTLNKTTKTSM